MDQRSKAQPRLYERVADDIRTLLTSGQYGIGDKLPSERDLSSKLAVSRPTVREAMLSLEMQGLVDIRTNSGVYVASLAPRTGEVIESDVGPFELLEARRTFESEVCALAASQIGDDEIAVLEDLIDEMNRCGDWDPDGSSAADRAFHLAVAQATRNSAMVKTVSMLWDERDNSRQYRALWTKARQAGIHPQVSDHEPILKALAAHDQPGARHAMWEHISQVIDALLAATEVEQIERVRAEVEQQRRRLVVARV